MASKALPSPEVLRQLLCYEPETGKLFWKERGPEWFESQRMCKIWNARYSGRESFTTINQHGYRHGSIFDRKYHGHRVVWAIYYGEWPVTQIDHINGLREDNRIHNLRIASAAQNQWNVAVRSDNSSGFRGVFWNSRSGKWQARIEVHGSRRHLGYFDKKEEAATAYNRASSDLHGNFRRSA